MALFVEELPVVHYMSEDEVMLYLISSSNECPLKGGSFNEGSFNNESFKSSKFIQDKKFLY